ncbi:FAD-dependent oxidoreductase [Brachyspira aalborgi]|uniref:FAD-dependent oxidoreductase n=1 Tax=Brachyspira aalborgi TaxID=29522 RepID=UPI00266B6960|nr:FAD-dependent oxidoreductase [Brachyspira aalborgi]
MRKTRDEILSNIGNNRYDIIIIGGGVIGATIAFKTSRVGLSTLLLEKHDFSFGASSRTGKILNGGYNDLTTKNIISTIYKVRERNNLIYKSSASQTGILYPIYEYGKSGIFGQELKSNFYDLLSIFSQIKRHTSHSRNSALECLPDLINNDVIAGIEYNEGMLDDSRYVMELLLKAEENGADILNYAEVKIFEYNNKEIQKVILSDKITGRIYETSAKDIVISAGAWGHELSSTLPNGSFNNKVQYIKASHLIVNSDIIHINKSVVLPKIKDRPNVFLMKWKDTLIIGPTIKKYNGNLDCIYATSDEIEYLLDIYNTYFSSIVNKNHIITTQSGMMPVNSTDIKIHSHPNYRLFLVEGGNFTLSSLIAVKTLLKIYGKPHKWFSVGKFMNNKIDKKIEWVLKKETIDFLINYFNSVDLAIRLNEFCKNDSSLLVNVGLDERIPRGLIKYFVEVEHALHLDDIMIRRLRFILTENDCGTLLAEHIAEEMANILGWNQKRIEWEIKRYRTEIKRARVSLY